VEQGVTPCLVARASLLTQLKALFTTLSFSLLLVMLALRAWRRMNPRPARPN
jgi:hypothetical protein